MKLALYNIFVRSRRERERVPLLPAAGGRRNRRLVDCRNHGRELSITVPRWPSGFFSRRTGSSNTAYPRSFGRCRTAWRQFSAFSPRRFRVFHDTNTLEVP